MYGVAEQISCLMTTIFRFLLPHTLSTDRTNKQGCAKRKAEKGIIDKSQLWFLKLDIIQISEHGANTQQYTMYVSIFNA